MDKQTLVGVGEWVIDTSNQLGKGSYGNVFVCHLESDPNKKFAAKKIPLSNNQKDTEKINTELRIFKKVNSPYVVTMHAFKKTTNSVYIFMDLCVDGSLRGYVETHGKLKIGMAMDFFQKLVSGYKDLRQEKVLHRDLKPDNVLIDKGIPKLTDFGLGRIFEDMQQLSDNQTKSLVGSEYYMAPELLEYVKLAYQNGGKLTERPHYTDKSDVWSMAMVFYYMLVGQKPWEYKENTQGYINNIKSKPVLMDPEWPLFVQHILVKMLTIDANNRISWEEVFNHPAVNPQVLQGQSQQNLEQATNTCVQQIQQYMSSYPQQNQYQLKLQQAQVAAIQQFTSGAGPQSHGYVPMKVGGDDNEMEMEDD